MTLYYPKNGSSFGDLDGDGKTDTLSTLEDRLAAEHLMDRFEAELASIITIILNFAATTGITRQLLCRQRYGTVKRGKRPGA